MKKNGFDKELLVVLLHVCLLVTLFPIGSHYNSVYRYERALKIKQNDSIISKRVKNWSEIKKYSRLLGIPPALVATVQIRETGYLPFHKRDTVVSHCGAIGLHQIMPFHAKNFGYRPSDLKKPTINTKIACKLLKFRMVKYKGNIEKVLASYNGGDGQAMKPQNLRCKETRDYVSNGKRTYKYFASLSN